MKYKRNGRKTIEQINKPKIYKWIDEKTIASNFEEGETMDKDQRMHGIEEDNLISMTKKVDTSKIGKLLEEKEIEYKSFKNIRPKGNNHWICFDFDGVIAKYDGWKGFDVFGDPNLEVIEAIQELYKQGYSITIFTTRLDTPRLREYLKCNNVPYDTINSNAHNPANTSQKPIYECIVDDRAVNYSNEKTAELIRKIKMITNNKAEKEMDNVLIDNECEKTEPINLPEKEAMDVLINAINYDTEYRYCWFSNIKVTALDAINKSYSEILPHREKLREDEKIQLADMIANKIINHIFFLQKKG